MLGLDISCKQLGDDCNLKGIMSHLYIHFETIVARSSRTRSSNVAFYPSSMLFTSWRLTLYWTHVRLPAVKSKVPTMSSPSRYDLLNKQNLQTFPRVLEMLK